MRLSDQDAIASEDRSFRPLWVSSLVFASVVVAGYRVLERLEFFPLLLVLACLHLLATVRYTQGLSRQLLLSQLLVVLATVVGVVLHVVHIVGPAPAGWTETFTSFLKAVLVEPEIYFYLARYLMLFMIVVAVVALLIKKVLREALTIEFALRVAYVASAANVALDYARIRPLYHASGDLDAVAWFFTVGLFGLETSLPVYALVLVTCLGYILHRADDGSAVRRLGAGCLICVVTCMPPRTADADQIAGPPTRDDVVTTWAGLSEDELYLFRLELSDEVPSLIGYVFADHEPVVYVVRSWSYEKGRIGTESEDRNGPRLVHLHAESPIECYLEQRPRIYQRQVQSAGAFDRRCRVLR